MKGMRKISRGKGFAGVVRYGFIGEIKGPRELEGRVVGGNMSANDMDGLIDEFNSVAALRPDIEKPVWHNSLRLPKEEKISDKEWEKIGARYMQKMGFSKHHPYVCILHDDEDGQHIHIIASRVGLNSKIFLGQNENLESTKIIYDLEKEFGLKKSETLVPLDADKKIIMPDKRKATKKEVEKALANDEEPLRYQLQKLVDKALEEPATATQFVERLRAGGVDVRVNIASTGRLNGFSFGMEGIYFGGQKLGANYKLASLIKRGLTYEQDVESEFLRQFVGKTENSGVDPRTSPVTAAVRSESDAATSAGRDQQHRNVNAEDVQRAGSQSHGHGGIPGEDLQRGDRQGAGASEHLTHRDNGRVEVRGAQVAPVAGSGEQGSAKSGDYPSKSGQGHKVNHGHGGVVGSQSDGGVVSTGEIDPDGGAGPIKTGDKIADELASKAHYARIADVRKSIHDNKKHWEKFWQEMEAEQRKRQASKRKSPVERRRSMSQSQVAVLDELLGIISHTKDKYHVQVLEQLKGFRVDKFEIMAVDNRVAVAERKKAVPRTYSIGDLSKAGTIKYLGFLNLNGQDIYIRPAHPEKSGLVLVDDLNVGQISTLEALGLHPAVLLETSEHNYQAWLRINDDGFSREEHAVITKMINEKVGGDPASTDQEHFGRLATFPNRKPNRVKADGKAPYVNLARHNGDKAPAGEELLQLAREIVAQERLIAHEAEQARAIKVVAAREMKLPARAPGASIPAGWLTAAWERIERLVSSGAATNASEIDFRCAIELRKQNVGVSDAIRLFEELPVRIRKGGNTDSYVLRTVTRAYALVDLRIEGRDTKTVDLSKEAKLRYPHVFASPQAPKAPETLKTSNAIFARLKAQEAEKSLAELQEKIDAEGVKKPGD